MKGWRQTHSQIARQLALYYEDCNGICHPRFTSKLTFETAAEYCCKWAKRYFVPNPFTPSLDRFKGRETNIYAFIRQSVIEGKHSFSEICNDIFGIELNNLDKVCVYLTNFTDLLISDDDICLNNSLVLNKSEEIHPVIDSSSTEDYYHYFDSMTDKIIESTCSIINEPLQLIYFGAPGTGKSHKIKQVCQKYEHYRITFHPDTDYASFVGSYKPITHSEQVYTNMGDKAIPLKDSVTGEPVTTTKITYQYVYQAFLNAYIAAWKEQQNENPNPVFLVIEEINRGNCAQIFGDIFQLLDRNENGFSDYPIIADNDLKKELAKEFETLDVFNAESINGIYDDDIIAKIKSGSHLLLPNNLYIWATMNTSDQSLFPIDSAFKRRWDWKYVKIADSGKNYRISVNGNEYDWWEFVEAINSHIGTDTDQEDKKLGYFFAKATKNDEGKCIISADTFLSKVIFFIYNDVYKDFGFDDDIFKDEDGEVLTFANYFDQYGDTVHEKVERFIQNLELKPLTIGDASDMDGDISVPSTLKARVNGIKVWSITYAFYQILRAIACNYTFEELQSLVGEYVKRDKPVMKTIASSETYEKEKQWYNYKPLSTKDGLTFVITNQWKKEYIPQLMALAKAENVSYQELP